MTGVAYGLIALSVIWPLKTFYFLSVQIYGVLMERALVCILLEAVLGQFLFSFPTGV